MKQEIIFPWKNIGEYWRNKHFDFLINYYSQEFDVIVAENNDEKFNLSAARNLGIKQTKSDVVVIMDADILLSFDQINDSIEVARNNRTLVKPFSGYGYLTKESTEDFYESGLDAIIAFPMYEFYYANGFDGGVYIMSKPLIESIGGFDEDFTGYGCEDTAFHIACKKNDIDTTYMYGTAYHLYHPVNRTVEPNNLTILAEKYF